MTRNDPSTVNRLPEWFPRAVGVALGIACGWTVIEWILRRRGVVVLAEALGSPFAADWLLLVVGFPVLAGVLTTLALRAGQRPDQWGYRRSLRAVAGGVGGVLVAVVVTAGTAYLDRALFGLGEMNATFTSAVTAAITAEPALAALFLLGNGLVGPITEELVWRGVVQTELVDAWGPTAGIGVTAGLFALKHVVVDGTVARVTTLLALGVVFGLVRHRFGTLASTVTHVCVNTLSTATVVFLALG